MKYHDRKDKKLIIHFSKKFRAFLLLLNILCLQVLIAQQYNIMNYGAIGDGKMLNTKAIQKGIDLAFKGGGGEVIIPKGRFLTGTIRLKDNVELHFEKGSVLLASTKPEDFPRQKQPDYRSQKDVGGWYALIYAEGAKNISITGYGTIDGQGALQRPRPYAAGGDKDGRPRNILFISCTNVTVSDIHLINSGVWNQHYLNCEEVIVSGIRVYNHSNRNNDGIDIDGCRRFILTNAIIDSQDDAICLKSTGPSPCEEVLISNCIVSSFANGIKMGTESSGGFKNIQINNCIVKPSRHPIVPKGNLYKEGITGVSLEIVDGGVMQGVSINNIVIEQTMCPVYVRLGGRSRKYTAEMKTPKIGSLKNVTISNITAYNSGNWGCSITGIPGHKIENIQLNNFNIVQKGGVKQGEYLPSFDSVKEDIKGYPQPTVWKNLPSSGLFIRHVNNLSISNFTIRTLNDDPRPAIAADDVNGLVIKTLTVGKKCSHADRLVKRKVKNCFTDF